MKSSVSTLTVKCLLDRLGRENVRRAIYGDSTDETSDPPGRKALAASITRNKLPAHSFGVIEAMCHENGEVCPRHLFAFKRAAEVMAAE